MKSVTVDKLGIDTDGDQAVVFLREQGTNIVLPIWIGMTEATAIALQIQGQKASRPLTADLVKTILDTFDTRLLMVVINDMKDGIFLARLFLRGTSASAVGSTIEIDARPSDAIALALRFDAPIYVADWILEEAGAEEVEEEEGGETAGDEPRTSH